MPSDLGGELGLCLVGCRGLGGKASFESFRLLDSLAREGDQYKPHHWDILKQDLVTSVKEEPEWLQETGESRVRR